MTRGQRALPPPDRSRSPSSPSLSAAAVVGFAAVTVVYVAGSLAAPLNVLAAVEALIFGAFSAETLLGNGVWLHIGH